MAKECILAAAGLLALVASAVAMQKYTVKPGDSLSAIAEKNGVSAAAIIKANGLKKPDDLSVGQVLVIPSPAEAAAIGKYTVAQGDTLTIIARKHGVSDTALAELNHIENRNSLSIGQVLLIPASGTATAMGGPKRALPGDAKSRIDKIKVVRGKWRFIVVHHSGSTKGTMRGMDEYHRRKRHMENGLAYHFVIGNGQGIPDGQVEIGDRWKRQIRGGHLASEKLNEKSIGICLVGNFNKTRPTAKQMASLNALIEDLLARCQPGAGAVKLHRQINPKPTECPGKHFPATAIVKN
ncbi:MAG TPA: LysM peptidoglycan-binding domain-containing protein [Kiritimatiellia bacterium]